MCLGDSVVFSQRSSTRPAQVLPATLLFPANHLWLICPAHQPFHATYGTLGSVPAAVHSQSFTSSRWTITVLTAPFSVILDAQRHVHRTRCGKVQAHWQHCMYPGPPITPHPWRPFDESNSLCMANVTSCAVRSQCVGCAGF
jgi:hypothetical protein